MIKHNICPICKCETLIVHVTIEPVEVDITDIGRIIDPEITIDYYNINVNAECDNGCDIEDMYYVYVDEHRNKYIQRYDDEIIADILKRRV